MATREQRRVNEIKRLRKYHSEVLDILQQAERSYDDIKDKILKKQVEIPKVPKRNLYDLFQIRTLKRPKFSSIEQFNNYLKNKICDSSVLSVVNDNVERSFEALFDHLLHLKRNMKIEKRGLFYNSARFGYFLHLFYIEFFIKKNSSAFNETWCEFVKDNFEISDTYSRTLRFIGKLCGEFKKLQQLSISVTEFYSYKEYLKVLFLSNKHDNLKRDWV